MIDKGLVQITFKMRLSTISSAKIFLNSLRGMLAQEESAEADTSMEHVSTAERVQALLTSPVKLSITDPELNAFLLSLLTLCFR